jgi:hypothetical protein
VPHAHASHWAALAIASVVSCTKGACSGLTQTAYTVWHKCPWYPLLCNPHARCARAHTHIHIHIHTHTLLPSMCIVVWCFVCVKTGGCPAGTGGPNCEECKANTYSFGGRPGNPRPKCKPCGLHFTSPSGSISAEYCECAAGYGADEDDDRRCVPCSLGKHAGTCLIKQGLITGCVDSTVVYFWQAQNLHRYR